MGDPECWEICFDELVHCYARASSCSASVISLPCGAERYTLRPCRTSGQAAWSVLGAPPISVELSRGGKVLRNLSLMHGPADGGDLSGVPRDPEQYLVLPVDEIFFTHGDVSDHFKDGRPIMSLVDELVLGKHDPATAIFLELDVVWADRPPRYWSFRNRRLYALKVYQQRLRAQGRQVLVKVCRLPLDDLRVLSKFAECWSTQDGGLSVEVRHSSRAGLHSNSTCCSAWHR